MRKKKQKAVERRYKGGGMGERGRPGAIYSEKVAL